MKTQRRKVSSEDDLTIYRCNKRSKTLHNSLPIPIDLIIEIFSRLPAKSIARCRCVSKRWASMLRSPDFTEFFLTKSHARPQLLFSFYFNGKMHFFSTPQVQNENSSSIINENSSSIIVIYHRVMFPCVSSFEFCGSVRGVICFKYNRISKGNKRTVPVISNLSTGQFLPSFPEVMTKQPRRKFAINTFFGYDPIEKQYKVLSMTLVNKLSEEHQVLTLGTRKLSWKRIGCCLLHYPLSKGICLNGVLYYLARGDMHSTDCMIVCFDFRTEMFRRIKVMESVCSEVTLANYTGKLALLTSKYVFGMMMRSFEMHVLQDPEKHEWSKHVYELPPTWNNLVGHTMLEFVGATGTNEILFSPGYISNPFYVFYYNTESKTIRRVEIQGVDAFKRCSVHTSVNYVEDVKLMEMTNTYNLRSRNSS